MRVFTFLFNFLLCFSVFSFEGEHATVGEARLVEHGICINGSLYNHIPKKFIFDIKSLEKMTFCDLVDGGIGVESTLDLCSTCLPSDPMEKFYFSSKTPKIKEIQKERNQSAREFYKAKLHTILEDALEFNAMISSGMLGNNAIFSIDQCSVGSIKNDFVNVLVENCKYDSQNAEEIFENQVLGKSFRSSYESAILNKGSSKSSCFGYGDYLKMDFEERVLLSMDSAISRKITDRTDAYNAETFYENRGFVNEMRQSGYLRWLLKDREVQKKILNKLKGEERLFVKKLRKGNVNEEDYRRRGQARKLSVRDIVSNKEFISQSLGSINDSCRRLAMSEIIVPAFCPKMINPKTMDPFLKVFQSKGKSKSKGAITYYKAARMCTRGTSSNESVQKNVDEDAGKFYSFNIPLSDNAIARAKGKGQSEGSFLVKNGASDAICKKSSCSSTKTGEESCSVNLSSALEGLASPAKDEMDKVIEVIRERDLSRFGGIAMTKRDRKKLKKGLIKSYKQGMKDIENGVDSVEAHLFLEEAVDVSRDEEGIDSEVISGFRFLMKEKMNDSLGGKFAVFQEDTAVDNGATLADYVLNSTTQDVERIQKANSNSPSVDIFSSTVENGSPWVSRTKEAYASAKGFSSFAQTNSSPTQEIQSSFPTSQSQETYQNNKQSTPDSKAINKWDSRQSVVNEEPVRDYRPVSDGAEDRLVTSGRSKVSSPRTSSIRDLVKSNNNRREMDSINSKAEEVRKLQEQISELGTGSSGRDPRGSEEVDRARNELSDLQDQAIKSARERVSRPSGRRTLRSPLDRSNGSTSSSVRSASGLGANTDYVEASQEQDSFVPPEKAEEEVSRGRASGSKRGAVAGTGESGVNQGGAGRGIASTGGGSSNSPKLKKLKQADISAKVGELGKTLDDDDFLSNKEDLLFDNLLFDQIIRTFQVRIDPSTGKEVYVVKKYKFHLNKEWRELIGVSGLNTREERGRVLEYFINVRNMDNDASYQIIERAVESFKEVVAERKTNLTREEILAYRVNAVKTNVLYDYMTEFNEKNNRKL